MFISEASWHHIYYHSLFVFQGVWRWKRLFWRSSPGSNCDPYRVVEAILKTIILEEEFNTKPSIAAATVLSIDELMAQAKCSDPALVWWVCWRKNDRVVHLVWNKLDQGSMVISGYGEILKEQRICQLNETQSYEQSYKVNWGQKLSAKRNTNLIEVFFFF